jgi:hypothetical protein
VSSSAAIAALSWEEVGDFQILGGNGYTREYADLSAGQSHILADLTLGDIRRISWPPSGYS